MVDGGAIVGPPGPRGTSVVMTAIAPGALCTAGGVRLELEDGGAAQVICNGVAGANGQNGSAGVPGLPGASVTVSAIDGGACPYGGVRVAVDGGQPAYVCNGAPGAQGPQGLQGIQGQQGQQGQQGAQGQPGQQGPQGPQGQQGLQGIQGAPGTSVVMTGLVVGDPNCANGGTRFQTGTLTAFACNGATGPQGPQGPAGSGGGSGGSTSSSTERYAFDGFTTQAFSGNLGGPQGAHAKCNAEHPGSHLCTWREYEIVGSSVPMPTAGAWVDGARYPSTSTPNVTPRDRDTSYTCGNWRDSGSAYGTFVDNQGVYSSTTTAGSCGATRPLACCHGPEVWFKGFTTLSWSGNLGGPQGAHAKCNAEFAGAHLCTWREYELTGSAVALPTNGAWVDGARYPSSSTPAVSPRDRDTSYTCGNWRDSGSAYGTYLDAQGVYSSTTTAGSCGATRALACCGG